MQWGGSEQVAVAFHRGAVQRAEFALAHAWQLDSAISHRPKWRDWCMAHR